MGDISFTGVINDLAEKFIKNENTKEKGNLKTEIRNEMNQNNQIIGQELEKMKEFIVQQGGKQEQQSQMAPMAYPMPMPMPMPMYGQMMPPMGQPMVQPMNTIPQNVQKPMTKSQKKGKKGKKTKPVMPEDEEIDNPMDEIDEELRRQEVEKLEEEQDSSMFSIPGKIFSSVGQAAKSALSTDDENMGVAADGKPFELPTEGEIMEGIGKGIKNATNIVKGDSKNNEKSFFSEMASNMTNNIVDGVKKIGKGALGTIDNASKMTNNAVKLATNRKCNPDFMNNFGGIVDTCERDNYVEIYNIILEKLKLKKNFFDENIKNDIENLKPLNLETKLELTPENNTLGVESDLDVAERIVEADIDTPIEKKQTKKKKKGKDKVKKEKTKKGKVRKGKATKFLKGRELITGIQV